MQLVLCCPSLYRWEVALARKLTEMVQLKLRFDERLRRRLEQEARKRGRSMNTEIIHRLERSFEWDAWREERLTLIMALRTHPSLTQEQKTIVQKHEMAEEREFQGGELLEIMTSKKQDERQ
jgi:hypothetical protein